MYVTWKAEIVYIVPKLKYILENLIIIMYLLFFAENVKNGPQYMSDLREIKKKS